MNNRQPPRYVPTLTDVVQAETAPPKSVSAPSHAAGPLSSVDLEALTAQVLERVGPALAQQMEAVLDHWLQEWTRQQAQAWMQQWANDAPVLMGQTLQRLVRDAIAQGLTRKTGSESLLSERNGKDLR